MKIRPEDALEYHSAAPAGKVSVVPTKPCSTQRDLSLAYTPGVAVPAWRSSATRAWLPVIPPRATWSGGQQRHGRPGAGNIGAWRASPSWKQGRPVQTLRHIDVFDIELDTQNPDEIIRTCQILEPTFGGINWRHQGAGVLLHRGRVAEDHENPGLPRRSAWHAIISGAACSTR